MLNDKNVAATIAVRDLAEARKFYEETLGLEAIATEGAEAVTYRAGTTSLLVYRSKHAGTNRATAATWIVGDDLETIAKDLRARGVKFEHYDFPEAKLEGDVHVFGDMRNAWFTDPDGNILSLVNGRPAGTRVAATPARH